MEACLDTAPTTPMSSATPSATGPPADGEEPPAAPELPTPSRTWTGLDRLGLDRLGLDRLGLTQAIGGLALGLITLYSSYDHITINGRTFPIPQQWGITFIVASVAIFFTGRVQYGAPLGRDAQLASRSRLRAAIELEVERDRTAVDPVGRRPWRENARLAKLNARDDALSALIKQHCFPPSPARAHRHQPSPIAGLPLPNGQPPLGDGDGV